MSSLSYDEIVTNVDSPTLVLAGPGAGKTYLLSDRIVRLLSSGVSKDEITVVTFGKDASVNMRNGLLDPNGDWKLDVNNIPKIATLNSLGFEIVNKSPKTEGLRKKGLTVQHSEDIKKLIYRDAAYFAGYDLDIANSARLCKSKGDCILDDNKPECQVCIEYWKIMSKCDRIDFDDQVLFACRILEQKSEILEEYQKRAKHLLVDEYQDINAAQHKLIELISRASRNGLFAVGDDAQSIYSFRGASPDFILDFKKYYPEAIIPPLRHSRRCHENILRKAEKVLVEHYDKWTGPFDLEFHREKGKEPAVLQMPSEKTEAKMVALLAKKIYGKGESVLVLSPKKELFIDVTKSLSKAGVPHVCPISLLPKFTEKRLTSLHTVTQWVKKPDNNFDTRLTLEMIINGGVCKVPGAKTTKKTTSATKEKREKVERKIANLWDNISRKKGLYEVLCEAGDLCNELQTTRDIMKRLVEKHNKQPAKEPAEFLRTASQATGAWMKAKNFVDDIAIITGLLRDKDVLSDDQVKLMTMRKAKGLEADVVIMIGLEDDLIPNQQSQEEEEARIFYVSMTRAKRKLFMLHARRRPRNISYGEDMLDKRRSRFLEAVNIDSKYIHIKP